MFNGLDLLQYRIKLISLRLLGLCGNQLGSQRLNYLRHFKYSVFLFGLLLLEQLVVHREGFVLTFHDLVALRNLVALLFMDGCDLLHLYNRSPVLAAVGPFGTQSGETPLLARRGRPKHVLPILDVNVDGDLLRLNLWGGKYVDP